PPPAPPEETLRRRLMGALVLRLAVATLLLGGTLLFAVDGSRGYSAFTPASLIALITATYAISGLSAGLLASGATRGLAWAQLAFDLLLTTGLTYLSGAAGSVFTILYGVVILNAAFTVGPAGARVVAVGALGLYLGLGYAVARGLLPPPPDQNPRPYQLEAHELGFALFSNVVALLSVAGLAGGLASRLARTGGELRRAEASASRLARLNDDIVRSLSAGLLTLDAEGVIQTANPAAGELLGAAPEALVGRPVLELLPLPPELDDRDTEERSDVEAHRVDGSSFPAGYTRSPLWGADGAVSGTLVIFQDLTEIRSLREQAERAERLAALGRLASALAHEIRNPLGSISGSVQIVAEVPELHEEDRHLLDLVLSETERLNELVTTMLDLSKPARPRPSRVDLVALARDLVAMARGDTTLGRVRVEVVAEREPLEAWVDRDRVRQLLWNLLKNAIQASPTEGEVTIRLDPEEGGVALSVVDQGAGIPQATREHLFDMFYSRRDHGMGIGLALVKQIVDMHAGTIEVGDGPDGGAAFRVWLPGAPAEAKPAGDGVPPGGEPEGAEEVEQDSVPRDSDPREADRAPRGSA
ncbi:MAG TPA: ATP-binding protein, partial [Polyangiaceae bacterium LLY-WYZ-15_(1-7)]|nr:ATP-binding protein [Polyangiaceae bacterium LLY-WYZ-15_(1-7)]